MSFNDVYLKLTSTLSVLASKAIPNFHKNFDDVDSVFKCHYTKPESLDNEFDIYFPTNCGKYRKLPVAFYVHGGGWTTLDKSMYQTLCRRFAQKNLVVINLNYTLAPKKPLEKIVEELEYAITFCLNYFNNFTQKIEIDKNSIILVGDSAGAHLVSLIAARSYNPQYIELAINNPLFNCISTEPKYPVLCPPKTSQDKNNNDLYVLNNPCTPIRKRNDISAGLSSVKLKNENLSNLKNGQMFEICDPNYSLYGKIKALLLFYGVYDFSTIRSTGFRSVNKFTDVLFGEEKCENKHKMYALSPINFITENYPPTLLASGELDKLHTSQSLCFSKVLDDNNILTEKVFFKKSEFLGKHGFMSVDGIKTNVLTHKQIDIFLNKVLK